MHKGKIFSGGYGLYWLYCQYYIWKYGVRSFLKNQDKLTEGKAAKGNLLIGPQNQNQERVLKFVCNPFWNIEGCLEQAEKNSRVKPVWQVQKVWNKLKAKVGFGPKQQIQTQKNWIYFYGDPGKIYRLLGIGKTTAFCAIFTCLNNKATSKKFKEHFPFFKKYKNFICIHAGEQSLEKLSVDQIRGIGEYLVSNKYFVMIDDAHLLGKKGQTLRDFISSNSDWIILLSSQVQNWKEFSNVFNLTELPHSDAIEQIVECFKQNDYLRFTTPTFQKDYLAYRIWYYTGGNMRNIKFKVLHGDVFKHSNFYENAHENAMKQKVRPFSDNKGETKNSKLLYFGDLFKTLLHERGIQLEEIVDLHFNFTIGDQQEDLIKFEDNNILRKNPKRESFHSRRAQYAFSRWILDHYPEIEMKEGAPSREEFRQLLEKIEYKYILGFEEYSLKQIIKKTNPDFKDVDEEEEEKAAKVQLDRKERIAKSIELREQLSQTTGQKLEGVNVSNQDLKINKETEEQSVIQIAKAQKEIMMKLYEAYQAQNGKGHSFEPEFTAKPIMRDLLKGEEHFKKVKGFDTSKVNQEEVAKIKEQVDKRMKKGGVAKRRAQVYEERAKDFFQEFQNNDGFIYQKYLIESDFSTEKIITEEMLINASNELVKYLPFDKPFQQVIVCALELAVDSHNRMVQTAVKDSKEEKKGGQPNN